MRARGAIPPMQEGYLSDSRVTPHESTKKRIFDTPLRCYRDKVFCAMGYLELGRQALGVFLDFFEPPGPKMSCTGAHMTRDLHP